MIPRQVRLFAVSILNENLALYKAGIRKFPPAVRAMNPEEAGAGIRAIIALLESEQDLTLAPKTIKRVDVEVLSVTPNPIAKKEETP